METIEIKRVQELLDRYFDAQTTLGEEKMLREYFKGEVSQEFLVYKPLFNCYSEEIERIEGVKVKRRDFRWISVAAAAALALFTFVLMPDRGDSLRLVIDGVNVKNRELAISKADNQINQLNSMLGKFKQGSAQLDNMNRMGTALSPLESLGKVLTQNREENRLN